MRQCANPSTNGDGCGAGIDWGDCRTCHNRNKEYYEEVVDRIDQDDPVLDEIMDAWIEGNSRTPKLEG